MSLGGDDRAKLDPFIWVARTGRAGLPHSNLFFFPGVISCPPSSFHIPCRILLYPPSFLYPFISLCGGGGGMGRHFMSPIILLHPPVESVYILSSSLAGIMAVPSESRLLLQRGRSRLPGSHGGSRDPPLRRKQQLSRARTRPLTHPPPHPPSKRREGACVPRSFPPPPDPVGMGLEARRTRVWTRAHRHCRPCVGGRLRHSRRTTHTLAGHRHGRPEPTPTRPP